jgi:hypothetical protein
MEKVRRYYFRLKFWPDKEHRKTLSDACLLEDEPNIYELLKYRNGMRLYYLNWFDVWETYSWLTTYFPPVIIPLVWIISGSWIAGVSLIVLWFWSKRFIVGKYRYALWGIKILIPGLFDRQLTEKFGPLPPFEYNEIH